MERPPGWHRPIKSLKMREDEPDPPPITLLADPQLSFQPTTRSTGAWQAPKLRLEAVLLGSPCEDLAHRHGQRSRDQCQGWSFERREATKSSHYPPALRSTLSCCDLRKTLVQLLHSHSEVRRHAMYFTYQQIAVLTSLSSSLAAWRDYCLGLHLFLGCWSIRSRH